MLRKPSKTTIRPRPPKLRLPTIVEDEPDTPLTPEQIIAELAKLGVNLGQITQPTHLAASRINDVQAPLVVPSPPVKNLLLEPDVFSNDPRLGLLFVYMAQRILEFAKGYPSEVPPEKFAETMVARLVMKDPQVKCVLIVTEQGQVIGHLLATIEGNMDSKWVFCWQAQVDEPHTGSLDQAMEMGIQWGKQHGCTSILMATQIDPEFWVKRYGFSSLRTVMSRPLP